MDISENVLLNKVERILNKFTLSESSELYEKLKSVESQVDIDLLFEPEGYRKLRNYEEKETLRRRKLIMSSLKPLEIELRSVSQQVSDVVEKDALELKSRITVEKKKDEVLSEVHRRLLLNPEEVNFLEGPINENFFEAVRRLQSISHEASQLIRQEKTTIGFELLDYVGSKKELIAEKCYEFVRSQLTVLKEYELEEEKLQLFRQALFVLADQPTLLNSCLEEMANILRTVTKGGERGVPPPIEDHIDDPLRYLNDMLALIHQTLASEKEFLGSVLEDLHLDKLRHSELDVQAQNEDIEQSQVSLCKNGTNTEDILRKKVLERKLTVIILFKLSNLLEFYEQLLESFLGKDTPFIRTLLECSTFAMSHFFQTWQERFDMLSDVLPTGEEDSCSPPSFVYQCTNRVGEIMDTLDMSLLSDEKKEGHTESIFSVVLDPLQDFCYRTSQRMDNVRSKIFIINCLELIRSALFLHSFAAPRVEMLTRQIDQYLDMYIEDMTKLSLEKSGLLEKVLRLESCLSEDPNMKVAQVAGMDAESIAVVLKNFHMSVLSGVGMEDLLNPPFSDRLSNTRMRTRVKIAVSEALISSYDTLYNLLNDSRKGYDSELVKKMGVTETKYIRIALSQ
eukprot:jgi/Galph1/4295/GphlegSOOS_G2975.1